MLRSDDKSDTAVSHPLLRSWGRPYRERTVLLASAESRGLPVPVPVGDGDEAEDATATSLLARLQRDLRADRAPTGDFDLDPSDRSIQVHSCHGPARQVQVLRDAILHLLADDPTLREEDIVVICPAVGEFAALVEAGFGTSAEEAVTAPDSAPPRLLYRITDRSLRDSYPVIAALDSLLALVSGRFAASEVMEFIALPAVRRRFEFDGDALRTIADWIEEANVRWGLDGQHREPWGFPPEFSANSWRAALDRLLIGVAVSDDDLDLAPGGIAPLGVEGGDIAVAGRLADLVARLASMAEDMRRPRTAAAVVRCPVGRHRTALRSRGRPAVAAGSAPPDRRRDSRQGRRRWQARHGRDLARRPPAPPRGADTGDFAPSRLLPGRHHRHFPDAASVAALPRDLHSRARRGPHERSGGRHRRRRSRGRGPARRRP